jgi:hypothetical protein
VPESIPYVSSVTNALHDIPIRQRLARYPGMQCFTIMPSIVVSLSKMHISIHHPDSFATNSKTIHEIAQLRQMASQCLRVMELSLQPIINNENKRRSRRRSENRNATTTIHPLQPSLPPQRLAFSPETRLWSSSIHRRGLHPALNRVSWEEQEVIRHSCACACYSLLPQRQGGALGAVNVWRCCAFLLVVLPEEHGDSLFATEPSCAAPALTDQGSNLSVPETHKALVPEDVANNGWDGGSLRDHAVRAGVLRDLHLALYKFDRREDERSDGARCTPSHEES